MSENHLRYPTGKFEKPAVLTNELINQYIAEIAGFPARIRKEVEHLTDKQLDTVYRPDGWTIRQVVNHCSDSHINAFIRFKLTLTEDKPIVKPYLQALWAELSDCKTMPIEPVLDLLDGLHKRWVVLLKSLSENELNKSYINPEQGNETKLYEAAALYSWHCNHHLAHITTLKIAKGW